MRTAWSIELLDVALRLSLFFIGREPCGGSPDQLSGSRSIACSTSQTRRSFKHALTSGPIPQTTHCQTQPPALNCPPGRPHLLREHRPPPSPLAVTIYALFIPPIYIAKNLGVAQRSQRAARRQKTSPRGLSSSPLLSHPHREEIPDFS